MTLDDTGGSLRVGVLGYAVMTAMLLILCTVWAVEYPLVLVLQQTLSAESQIAFAVLVLLAGHAMFVVYLAPYIINSCSFDVELREDSIEIGRGWRRESVALVELQRAAFLTGGRGWRYIGLVGRDGVTVVTNALYLDARFDLFCEALKRRLERGRPPTPFVMEGNGPGKLGEPLVSHAQPRGLRPALPRRRRADVGAGGSHP